jgi:adenine-specific DNA-methyltransferase
MIKDIEKDNENVAINTKEIAILREHFPACFKSDGSFDIERFKEELKDKVDIVHEGYELKFLGKSYAKLLASLDTTTVITPNTEHNNLEENKNSENIYISGDNLDGLKHLLKSYAKSVKCIYIDPPYNTGSDGFVYKDNFNFTTDELQYKLSVDETQANRIIDLTKRNSASHSAWLMFMYSRLQLAKDLLTQDGVIFISIDDNEQANLKLLCDDVFGEENFVSSMVWSAGKKNDSKHISNSHEYILVYFRDINYIKQLDIKWRVKKNGLKEIYDKANEFVLKSNKDYEKATKNLKEWFKSLDDSNPIKRSKHYCNIDDNGVFFADNISWPGGGGPTYDILHPLTNKPVKIPSRGWLYGTPERMQEFIDKGLVLFGKDENSVPTLKSYLSDREYEVPYSVLYKDGRASTKRLMSLFDDKKIFDNPKDENILSDLFNFISEDKDITILDFFSGSASTAHAVLNLNSIDNGNRRFISVQIPQELDIKNNSQKLAIEFLKSNNLPTTLDYIGFERIKRAAKKIKEVTKAEIDYGFKHFILNEPNQNTLDKCETFDKAGLVEDATIIDNFGTATVLTTWLNSDGYGLNAKVQTIDLNGYEAYYCQKHLYLINPYFTQEAMVSLVEKYDTIGDFNPDNIVLFGYSFIEWSATEMLEQNLKILNDSEKNLKINIDVRY